MDLPSREECIAWLDHRLQVLQALGYPIEGEFTFLMGCRELLDKQGKPNVDAPTEASSISSESRPREVVSARASSQEGQGWGV